MPIDPAAQTQLVELAQLRLAQRDAAEPLSREEIARTVDQLLAAFPEWRDRVSLEAALTTLGSIFSPFVGEDSVLRAHYNHTPWLAGPRAPTDWPPWEPFRAYTLKRTIVRGGQM